MTPELLAAYQTCADHGEALKTIAREAADLAGRVEALSGGWVFQYDRASGYHGKLIALANHFELVGRVSELGVARELLSASRDLNFRRDQALRAFQLSEEALGQITRPLFSAAASPLEQARLLLTATNGKPQTPSPNLQLHEPLSRHPPSHRSA